MNIKEIEKKLKAPFQINTPNGIMPAHKWKVNNFVGDNCMCVPYIDARQVAQRLDEVVGADNWENILEPVDNGMLCTLIIHFGEKKIVKSDVGTSGNIEKEKSMASDAFKRAAVKFGIGAYLYDMQAVMLPKKGKYPTTKDGKKVLYTGDQLTAYINTMHPLRLKLSEIYNALKDPKKYNEIFKQIWEDLK